jgi:hypothetical protein
VKARWLRLRRFIGIRGTLMLGFYGLLLTTGLGASSGLAWGIVIPIGVLTGVGVVLLHASTRYQRSEDIRSYRSTLHHLVNSTTEFCLVLRPFGRDGMTLVPKVKFMRRGYAIRALFGLRANTTMEQIVTAAARTARRLPTYAIVDTNVSTAPPGLTFLSTPDDDWQMVADQLISRAHTIVLIVPTNARSGAGFRWEVERIVDRGLQSRVLVVLPPPVRRRRPDRDALIEARAIISQLSGATAQLHVAGAPSSLTAVFPDDALVVRPIIHARAARYWFPVAPKRTLILRRQRRKILVSDITYHTSLVPAICEIEAEMLDWSFQARYPI